MSNSTDAGMNAARLRGKRVGLGIVTTVALAFIGASALQIIPAVFPAERPPGAAAPEGTPMRECARRVRSLALAIDRATANAWSSHAIVTADGAGEAPPLRVFRQALTPEWSDEAKVREICFESPEGAEAWAALVRMRSTVEQIIVRDFSDLLPLQHDFAAHLPADLR
jgi:hypothetical protein